MDTSLLARKYIIYCILFMPDDGEIKNYFRSDYDETQSNIPATIPENNMNTFFPPNFEGH